MTAAALKQIRVQAGLTQQAMANLLGVALRTYQGYEKGRPIPRHVDRLIACLKRLKKWGNPSN